MNEFKIVSMKLSMSEYTLLCMKARLNANLTRYLLEYKQSPLLYRALELLKLEFPENLRELNDFQQHVNSCIRLEVEYWTINWSNLALIQRFNQFVDTGPLSY